MRYICPIQVKNGKKDSLHPLFVCFPLLSKYERENRDVCLLFEHRGKPCYIIIPF